jgi:hypothetical protein
VSVLQVASTVKKMVSLLVDAVAAVMVVAVSAVVLVTVVVKLWQWRLGRDGDDSGCAY